MLAIRIARQRPVSTEVQEMNVTHFGLLITSENAERLIEFYRDVVGLTPKPEWGIGAFGLGETSAINIDGHSEVHGTAKEPQRHLVNLFVEDAAKEQARLEAAGVQFVRRLGREEWGGIISTFVDPDGNYLQLIQYDGPGE
jgi:predicted enzyme related to lactoylglutathione lyase